jgi:tetratricopeptide (TPR) repeat protein
MINCAALSELPRDGLATANAAIQNGEADKAMAVLRSLPQQYLNSAEAHNLRCRVFFTLQQWDAAGNECEMAVNLDGRNSDYHLWLGRALGERAEHASFVTAYSLAKRTREEFEQSVQLDPRNAAALADLGEFYSAAPSVVGGGLDKAERVAAQLDSVDAARACELRGNIAEGRKDFNTADSQFKQAIAVSTHPAFQWMTLASFYRRHERWAEMEAAVQSGAKAAERDSHSGVALYNGASVLSRGNRNLPLAAKMLEVYLSGSSKTEEAPAFDAHTLLARLKGQLGDPAEARHQRAAALELAHDYKPALELNY